jgi:hypothetical protein
MWCSFLSAAERRAARHRWEPRRPGASTGGMIDMTRTADLLMRGKFFALTTTMCLWGAQVMAADRLTTPFGDEHDLAGVGVGSEGEIGMAAPIRGVVNGHACERREVGLGEGEIDIAAANGVHPMPAFTNDAGDCRKRHLLGEHQYQRLEQQGEAGEFAHPIGLDERHFAVPQPKARHAHFEMAIMLEEVEVAQPLCFGYRGLGARPAPWGGLWRRSIGRRGR